MQHIGYSGVVLVFCLLPWCDDLAMSALDELWEASNA